jgi:Protein of unknown function (DUF3618)
MSPRDRSAKEQEKASQQAGQEAAQAVKDETGVGRIPPSDPQELREEIAESREALGDTVEALADKADVKSRVQEKVAERKEQVAAVGGQARERPVPLIAAGIGAAVLLLWLIRRK